MPEARLFPLQGAKRDDKAVDSWFAATPSKTRDLARKWLNEWRACGEDVGQRLHDGHPTVCIGDVALGYVNAFAHHVNVGFFLGSNLPDPAGLMQGTGKFMRHVKVRPEEPENEDQLRSLIRTAYVDLKTRLAKPSL